ncbi:hypothetical protein ABK040_002838 [Willaertia magna]
MVNRDFEDEFGLDFSLDKIDLSILNNNKIKFAKCGKRRFILITELNEIYGFGTNNEYQIGYLNPTRLYDFARIKYFTKLVKISENKFGNIIDLECGVYFTIIINDLNEIYITGKNNYLLEPLGHLYYTTFKKLNLSIPFESHDEKIKIIRGKDTFCYLLTNKNNIYVIGSNAFGQLGLNKKFNCIQFTKLDKFIDVNIKDIQLGFKFTIILDILGNIYFTGLLSYGVKSTIFTKMDLTFKVNKILIVQNNILFLNEFNELYMLTTLNIKETVNEIIKIKLENITGLYYSYGDYFIFKNKYNEYFGIGDNHEGQLGFNYSCCDLVGNKYYIKEPKKLDYLMTNRKHITMLALEHRLFILMSDYKINCNEPINEEEENINLQTKLFEKFMNGQLYDIFIC